MRFVGKLRVLLVFCRKVEGGIRFRVGVSRCFNFLANRLERSGEIF